MENLTTKLKATNIKFIENIFTDEDPQQLFIALNEFSYSIFVLINK